MPEYISRYRAELSGGSVVAESPSLDDLRTDLKDLPQDCECSVVNSAGITLYSGTVQQIREEIREALFPTPATRRDIEKLEQHVARLEVVINDLKGQIRELYPETS